MVAAVASAPVSSRWFGAWLSKGRRSRPWWHAAAAFVAGLTLPVLLNGGIVFTLLGGIPLVLILVVVLAAAVFGGIGRWGTGRAAGWWLALTVAPWFVSVVLLTLSPTSGESFGASPAWQFLLAGLVPAALALLTHAGPARAVAVLAIIGAIVIGWNAKNESDAVQAKLVLGSSVRPDVTNVPGYTPVGETQRTDPSTSSEALSWGYRRSGISTDGSQVRFVLTTDVATAAVCGPVLWAQQITQPEPETSCVHNGNDWARTSAHTYEIARIVHGKLVRVTAPNSTPKSVLTTALRNATPMNDRYYRHLLFGEKGQYLPELDGLR